MRSTTLGLLAAIACGCARELPISEAERTARDCIERLAAGPRTWRTIDGEIVEPPFVGMLVCQGADALSAVLDTVQRTDDRWLRSMLVHVLGRIGDERARVVLEGMLSPPEEREGVLDALGRLARPESLPALRAVLAQVAVTERVGVLEAMLRCGDVAALGELLKLGLEDEQQRSRAASAVLHHAPLRAALAFDATYGFYSGEELLLLQAADEWHHEHVLGTTSPWRPTAPHFTEPHAAAKQAAFDLLAQRIRAGNGEYGALRVQAVDPVLDASDRARTVTVVTGLDHHHGNVFAATIWSGEGDPITGFRFHSRGTPARTQFPHDVGGASCERLTMARADYEELLVGIATVLSARTVPWWHGPRMGSSASTQTLAVGIGGIDSGAAVATRHVGDSLSTESPERMVYERLLTALQWHDDRVRRSAVVVAEPLSPEVRRRFAALFVAEVPHWQGWVRELLTEMARDAGDDSLRAPLAQFLDPAFLAGAGNRTRIAARAINALAAITGSELRFDTDGTPRSIEDAAAAYRELLAR